MTLIRIQSAVLKALRGLDYVLSHGIPVLAEDEGNVVAGWDENFARTHLAVTVGAASFSPTSRDSRVVSGMARIGVTVWEQPSRNRVGQGLAGPRAAEAAEELACAAHLMPIGGGVLVLAEIGGVVRVDDKTVARTVTFETLAVLTGEEHDN